MLADLLRQRTRKQQRAFIACTLLAQLSASLAWAQQRSNYADYPQKRGETQPLQWTELPPWLTLGMELRGRVEGNTSYNYKQDGDRIYLLTRAFGSAEVRPARFLTGYLQFIDTHALGLPTPAVAANMRDAFDARQAYLNLHLKPRGIPVTAIAGRQELKFGSERVIGVSDWANNSRTFDGFDLRLGDKNRVDLFSTSVVVVSPTALDRHGAGLTFHGAYGQITTWIPKVNLQPYVLLHNTRNVVSQQGIRGDRTETTFGVEVSGQLPARFDYLVNGSLQRGSYSNNSIHAGQSFAKLNYSLPSLPWHPRIGAEFDYATGNSGRNPDRISTYDQQFPSNHNAFGSFDLFGYQNLRQERLNLDLGATKNLTFLVQGEALHLASAHDSLYGSAGTATIQAPVGGFRSGEIGQGLDLSGKYVFHNYVVVNFGVSHLFPGPLLLENRRGSAQTYAYFALTYRFRVDRHATPSVSSFPKTNAASSH